jgi:membrane protease YdiL (CAAX protease family)
MQYSRALPALAAVAGGLLFFVSAVALILGIGMYNASVTPRWPWFPVPVLALLFAAVWLMHRRFDIGLGPVTNRRRGMLLVFAVSSMIAAHCLLVLEGAFHGITRSFESAPAGVSPGFALAWWVIVVIAMSTASESAFRGLMQTRLAPLLGAWPAILVTAFVNLVVHRWDGLYERMVGVFAVLLAWGYLRHLAGSLRPAILAHIGTILAWDAILWTYGPWDHSAMGPGALLATATVGVVSLAGALWAAREARRSPAVHAGQLQAGVMP